MDLARATGQDDHLLPKDSRVRAPRECRASIRGLAKSKGSALGKSMAARTWAEVGRAKLEELRFRDLLGTCWLAMMIDGVFPADELCPVVAIGIDAEGIKQAGPRGGTSESAECVSGLLCGSRSEALRRSKDIGCWYSGTDRERSPSR